MLPDRVKNIFELIDFLESNKKAYIETYVPLTNMVLQLSNERSKLRPSNNYKERQQYDVIQKKMEEPCSLINNNVVKPILQRLLDLKIWDGDDTYASIWNNNAGAIHELTRNFADADVEEIKSYKQKYLDFRTETKTAFLSLALMFDNLDEVLKILFDFFKDAEANEFEPFETKTIPVDNAYEMVEEIKKGNTKFSLPIDFLNPSKAQQNMGEALSPHSPETHEAVKNHSCTSETFKTDISELCEKCPSVKEIEDEIKDVEFLFRQKKEVLTNEQFKKYVEGESESASKRMDEMFNLGAVPEGGGLTGNRMFIYILDKEKIKALNKLIDVLKEQEKQSWQPEGQTIKKQEDIFKEIIERNKLHDFLSVPAPDVLHKEAFWHDENDNPIDCNIYHPKYRYPGFKTYSKDVIAASFNTRHSYKDYDTGETIYAPYYLQMLCSADGMNFTNKDEKKVIKVDYTQKHLKRLALDENDFNLIYQREYNEHRIDGTKEAIEKFKNYLKERVQALMELHTQKNAYYNEKQDNNLLGLAERFIKFVQIDNAKSSAVIEAPEFALFCSIVDESKLFLMVEESKKSFCERVKERFKLPANPEQARKVFNRNMDVKTNDKYL